MYCDLWPYVLWPLDFRIQERIVSAETIWRNTVCKYKQNNNSKWPSDYNSWKHQQTLYMRKRSWKVTSNNKHNLVSEEASVGSNSIRRNMEPDLEKSCYHCKKPNPVKGKKCGKNHPRCKGKLFCNKICEKESHHQEKNSENRTLTADQKCRFLY